ncbi:hypothetical protein GCM10010319_62620 [Streptomyces blastmyceticus]|uniref:Uncharacterized protein n=1 Tax=Streptomyces blastmyceticus TaxID=68180 RepID=A0ABN0XX97_9ACTN
MSDNAPNEESKEPVEWTDPNQAHVVEHFHKEVAEAVRQRRRGCSNCGGLGKIIMVVAGEPKSYPCACGAAS